MQGLEHGLGPAREGWPLMRIERAERGSAAGWAGRVEVGEDRADIWLGETDRVEVEREPLSVRFRTAQALPDHSIAHPYLGLPASIAGHWLGRQVLHGSAFLHGDRAWALLGTKEAGKSSLAAALLARGLPALSDDILMTREGELYAGPATVDLRSEAAERLGGEHLGVVGARERWRLTGDGAPPSAPLGGIVQLEWGDRIELAPLSAGERLSGLVENSVIRPSEPDAAALLELAALPSWRFVRPRDFGRLDEGVDQLLAALG